MMMMKAQLGCFDGRRSKKEKKKVVVVVVLVVKEKRQAEENQFATACSREASQWERDLCLTFPFPSEQVAGGSDVVRDWSLVFIARWLRP